MAGAGSVGGRGGNGLNEHGVRKGGGLGVLRECVRAVKM